MNIMLSWVVMLIGSSLHSIEIRLQLPHREPTVQEVRSLAASIRCAWAVFELIELGSKAFPAYVVILSDPNSHRLEISGVLSAIICAEAPKGQFFGLTLPYLTHKDDHIRASATNLMVEIGTREEGPIFIALLSDNYEWVRFYAAKALEAHGGQRELAAMDVWLQSGTALRDKKPYLKHVKECRDMLEQRLKEAEKKEKEKKKK